MLDSSSAGWTADGGLGDSLAGVEVFWISMGWVGVELEVTGVSTCVTEQLLVARWSIIFVVGSGSEVVSIPFLVQNSEWVSWKVLRQ